MVHVFVNKAGDVLWLVEVAPSAWPTSPRRAWENPKPGSNYSPVRADLIARERPASQCDTLVSKQAEDASFR